MVINPKFNNKNELKNVEAKLKQYGEEYNNFKHELSMNETDINKDYNSDLQKAITKLKNANKVIKLNKSIIIIFLMNLK